MTSRSAVISFASCCPGGAFEIIEAATGAEGLARLREHSPDVVLLDLNMPEMDGFAFLDKLASAGGSRLPPVVVLTSMALDRDNRARLAGVSRVLSKAELSAPKLVEAIRTATHNKRRRTIRDGTEPAADTGCRRQ